MLDVPDACSFEILTQTMERRMKPAAAASFAPLAEYTRELTAEVVKTRPAPRKPTIYRRVNMD